MSYLDLIISAFKIYSMVIIDEDQNDMGNSLKINTQYHKFSALKYTSWYKRKDKIIMEQLKE